MVPEDYFGPTDRVCKLPVFQNLTKKDFAHNNYKNKSLIMDILVWLILAPHYYWREIFGILAFTSLGIDWGV